MQTTSNFGAGSNAGGGYTSPASSYPFLPPFGSSSNDPVNAASAPSLLVWPSKPFEVNTDLWRRLSGAPCASADHLLEKLNIYTPALAPYIGMTDVQVGVSESGTHTCFVVGSYPLLYRMISVPNTHFCCIWSPRLHLSMRRRFGFIVCH